MIEYHTWASCSDIKYYEVLTKVEKMAIFFVRLQAIFFVCVAIVAEQFFYRLIYKKCICIASHINVISIQQSNQQQN